MIRFSIKNLLFLNINKIFFFSLWEKKNPAEKQEFKRLTNSGRVLFLVSRVAFFQVE